MSVNTVEYIAVVVVCNSCCSTWYCTDCNGWRYWHRHVVQNIRTSCKLCC